MELKLKTVFYFFSLILITLVIQYYMPSIIAYLWLVTLLVQYWFSKDEPFWLAFFLVITDGFMSFFGLYETRLAVFPGLPAIELGHFYVILSVLKTGTKKPAYPVFYKQFLYFMGGYLIFLILLGLLIGINGELNAYFRVLKLTLPFLLFYSIPKLMRNEYDFIRFFALIFPIAFLASVAQLFELIMQIPLSTYLGAKEFVMEDIKDDEAYRTFYNPSIILLTFFGSLFFSIRKGHKFNAIYLNILTISTFSMTFLSATRGWIIGFGITFILYLLFVARYKPLRLFAFITLGIAMFFLVMKVPVLQKQINNAYDRFTSVEEIYEGDITAGETQIRTTIRSPRVLNKWSESPVTGFGFSDESRKYGDGHVGNQNVLLQSGIIGLALMISFFLYFMVILFRASLLNNDKSLQVFPIFFIGWFFIHSTSGQHFAYGIFLGYILTQIVFFTFGAFCVAELKEQLFINDRMYES